MTCRDLKLSVFDEILKTGNLELLGFESQKSEVWGDIMLEYNRLVGSHDQTFANRKKIISLSCKKNILIYALQILTIERSEVAILELKKAGILISIKGDYATPEYIESIKRLQSQLMGLNLEISKLEKNLEPKDKEMYDQDYFLKACVYLSNHYKRNINYHDLTVAEFAITYASMQQEIKTLNKAKRK